MDLYFAISPPDVSLIEEILGDKKTNVLISFYYFKNKDISLLKKHNIILDSGTFTFINKIKDRKINWDEYIEEYASFINKNDIDLFFELDIDKIIGIEEVERLRYKLETLTKKKSIPVWHTYRGTDYFKKMCKDYDYVAIGGLIAKDIKITKKVFNGYRKMVNYANSKGVKVHGLGATGSKYFKEIRFSSVDSTSWNGVMFAYRKYIFKEGKIKAKTLKGFKSNKQLELKKLNLLEWYKYQQYVKQRL